MRTPLAFTTLLALAIARAVDLLATFHFSPGLELEGNPIVNLFSKRAVGLVGISLVEFAFCCAGVILFWRIASAHAAIRPPRTFIAFIAAWLREVVGHRDSMNAWLPGGVRWKHSLQAIRMMAMALSWAIVFGSVVAARAWFALWGGSYNRDKALFSAISVHGATALPYLAAVVGWLIGAALFFWSEYRYVARKE